jgi:ABC-2 type transport system permease protein
MKPHINAELLKVRTTRSLYVAWSVVLLLTLALPVVNALVAGTGDVAPLRSSDLANLMRAPVQLAGAAMLLVGLLASAGEFRHRTVLTTRLTEPRGGRVLTAKLVAMGLLGLATGVVVSAVTLIESAIVFHRNGVSFEPFAHGVLQVVLTVPLIVALQALLGVAIGALLRNTAAAVGTTLVWAFVVEGLVPMLTRRPDTVNWLPTGLVREALHNHPAAGQLAPAAAGGLLLAYAVALVGVTAVLDSRREL